MNARAQTQKEPLSDARQWKLFLAPLSLTGLLIALLAHWPPSASCLTADSIVENHIKNGSPAERPIHSYCFLCLYPEIDCQCSPCHTGDCCQINCSYIGTRNITSRQDAFKQSGIIRSCNVVDHKPIRGLASSFAGPSDGSNIAVLSILRLGAIILLMRM